jgi:hypothetical protein
MNEYPEHEKMVKIKGNAQTIGEFMEWLGIKRIILCRYHDHTDACFGPKDNLGIRENMCGYRNDDLSPIYVEITDLLADYFRIDLKKIEEEKHQMLEELQECQN